MNEEKQIEEMAKAMCRNAMSNGNCSIDDEPCGLECVYGCCAERLYSKGYRKQSEVDVYRNQVDELEDELASTYDKLENTRADVAREIFEEIEKIATAEGAYDYVSIQEIAELKKKYTGEPKQ